MRPATVIADKEILDRAQRAGETAQALFCVFIEQTWTYDMAQVYVARDPDERIREIEVLEGQCKKGGPTSLVRTAGNFLYKLPLEIIYSLGAGSNEVVAALMADGNSVWAFVVMHLVVRRLFHHLVDNVDTDIFEVTHYLPGGTHRLVKYKGLWGMTNKERTDQPYKDDDARGVYEITLKTGEKIALDLAGAQSNLQHVPVTPWSEYCAHQGLVKSRTSFRSTYEIHLKLLRQFDRVSAQTIIMDILTNFNVLIDNAHSDPSQDLVRIENLSIIPNAETYWQESGQFIKAVRDTLKDLVHLYSLPPHFLLSPPKGFPDGLRHPQLVSSANESSIVQQGSTIPPTFASVKNFDWGALRTVVLSKQANYKEKKRARELLAHKYVVKIRGESDWRLSFLQEVPRGVPKELFSENPFWRRNDIGGFMK